MIEARIVVSSARQPLTCYQTALPQTRVLTVTLQVFLVSSGMTECYYDFCNSRERRTL